jgi:hypothetical protein
MEQEDTLRLEPHRKRTTCYDLDCAGIGFHLITNSRVTTVFRFSADLKEPVEPLHLRSAIEKLLPRFPYFRVSIAKGFFWPFLRENKALPPLEEEGPSPNQHMHRTGKDQLLFRIKIRGSRIALECHHCLTDGFGGLEFFRALLLQYAVECGIQADGSMDIKRPGQEPDTEETEDAWQRYYSKNLPGTPFFSSRAFLLPYKREPVGVYHVTTGIIPLEELLVRARTAGTTITAYMTAVYLDALQDIQIEAAHRGQIRRIKPVKLMVPVNLRRLFPSNTLRNFTLYVTPGIDPRQGRHTFEAILEEVHSYLKREVTAERIGRQLARNIRSRMNPLIMFAPLWLKKALSGLVYYLIGSARHSGSLTNLGKVCLPAGLEEQVERLEIIPPPLKNNKVGAAMLSFRDKMYVAFGRIIRQPIVEDRFFAKLRDRGISVEIHDYNTAVQAKT